MTYPSRFYAAKYVLLKATVIRVLTTVIETKELIRGNRRKAKSRLYRRLPKITNAVEGDQRAASINVLTPGRPKGEIFYSNW